MSIPARVAAAGMGVTLSGYFAVLGWVTVTYQHASSLPCAVNILLVSAMAAFAAFTGTFILFKRKDARERRA
jgi:hypothetical protein